MSRRSKAAAGCATCFQVSKKASGSSAGLIFKSTPLSLSGSGGTCQPLFQKMLHKLSLVPLELLLLELELQA